MNRKFKSMQSALKISVLVFAGLATLISCYKEDDNATNDVEIEKIAITPEDASMAVGEQEDFSAYALTTKGEKLYFDELDVESHWWSSDTDVFEVQENGVATGKSKGDAYCILEATIHLKSGQLKAPRLYTGRDSAFVSIF
jgi:hypothetical protein